MRLSAEFSGPPNAVRAYDRGYIVVNEQYIRRSVILTPERIVSDWPPQTFAELLPEHLQVLAELNLEVVLLGTGERQQWPPSPWVQPLLLQRIGVEAMATAAACRTFNFLLAEGRRVGAALMMI
jgi:uncharacterized protein